jgi:hypothetical protein
MRRVLFIAGLCLVGLAVSASAQHYDLYYVAPGETGSIGVDVGLASADISGIGDVGIIPVMGKYSVSDEIEVGAKANLGVLNDINDDLSSIEVGAKYGMGARTLTAAVLLPMGDADDPGLSIGAMHSMESGDLTINNWLQVGLLDGYTGGVGVNLDLLVEPTKAFGDKLTGYLDIIVGTNTDDIAGDHLGIDLGPNVDYMLNESTVINAGVTIGIAGDAKQGDIGLVVAAVLGL